ncbi:MAG: DUF1127 domain-containing protein [Roseinatronobacter sp.]
MSFYAHTRPHADRVFGGFQGLSLGTLFATLKTWNDARITRKQLNALSDRELADIGLERGEIERVAQRGF